MARSRVQELASAPYDLSHKALRAELYQVAKHDFILALGMHHVIGDQWSWGVISRDLTAFYTSRMTNSEPKLEPLTMQYKDYALWQVERAESITLKRSGSFWKTKLEGLPVLELPLDKPRPHINSNHGGVVRRNFLPEDIAGIVRLARKHGCTPYMVLLTCFATLLHWYSGMNDLPIGTPSANRDRKEFENLIGTFVNTLVLRIPVSSDDSFLTLLLKIKDIFLEAFDHREYPFERLVSDLNPARDSSHLPLAQVLFNLVNAPLKLPFDDNIPVATLMIEPEGSQFDLSLSIDLEIAQSAEYFFNKDIFNRESIESMADSYIRILQEAISNENIYVCEMSLMSNNQRLIVMNEWNQTDFDFSSKGDISDLLWASAIMHPEKVAAIFTEGSITYSSLFGKASNLVQENYRI
jgi:hypothetical protein